MRLKLHDERGKALGPSGVLQLLNRDIDLKPA